MIPYFYHGTTYTNLTKTSNYRFSKTPYIYANIFPCKNRLTRDDKTGGLGEITILIDPTIIKRGAYFNSGWVGDVTDKSIKLTSKNIVKIQKRLCQTNGNPYIMTHEVLIDKDVPSVFIIGIVVHDDKLRAKVSKLTSIKTFKLLPMLIK